jgi:hypothetical protein
MHYFTLKTGGPAVLKKLDEFYSLIVQFMVLICQINVGKSNVESYFLLESKVEITSS